jgi:hypothetical protein
MVTLPDSVPSKQRKGGRNLNAKEFKFILDGNIDRTRNVLDYKATHYASDTDRLDNFKRAAAMLNTTPEKALLGFTAKHIVSVITMVEGLAQGKVYKLDQWHEKLGDIINYCILLEALVTEGMEDEVVDRHLQNQLHQEIEERR